MYVCVYITCVCQNVCVNTDIPEILNVGKYEFFAFPEITIISRLVFPGQYSEAFRASISGRVFRGIPTFLYSIKRT